MGPGQGSLGLNSRNVIAPPEELCDLRPATGTLKRRSSRPRPEFLDVKVVQEHTTTTTRGPRWKLLTVGSTTRGPRWKLLTVGSTTLGAGKEEKGIGEKREEKGENSDERRWDLMKIRGVWDQDVSVKTPETGNETKRNQNDRPHGRGDEEGTD